MLGLKRGTVKLLKYDPEWINDFNKEKEKLKKYLGSLIVDIQHIGSTSIPGMLSKPIIDIDVGVKFVRDFIKVIKILIENGYEYRENAHKTNVHILFAKGPEENRTHYIHVIKYNGQIWKRDIAFRDYLRTDKEEAREYLNIKKDLAKKFSLSRDKYTKNKEKFIKRIISLVFQ